VTRATTGVVVLDILSEMPREASSPYALPPTKVLGSDAELADGDAEPPQATEQIESEISTKDVPIPCLARVPNLRNSADLYPLRFTAVSIKDMEASDIIRINCPLLCVRRVHHTCWLVTTHDVTRTRMVEPCGMARFMADDCCYIRVFRTLV